MTDLADAIAWDAALVERDRYVELVLQAIAVLEDRNATQHAREVCARHLRSARRSLTFCDPPSEGQK